MSVEPLGVPDPHYIPGYAGHCPEFSCHVGDTFGQATHKLLSKRPQKGFSPPKKFDPESIEDRSLYTDVAYNHPITAGYVGHIPRITDTCGQTFSLSAMEALDNFGKIVQKRKRTLTNLDHQTMLQDARIRATNAEDRELIKTTFKTPLHTLSPEYSQMMRCVVKDEPPIEPRCASVDPHATSLRSGRGNPRTGYAGHVPFGYTEFGKTQDLAINSALAKFATCIHNHLSTEFGPAQLVRPDPPMYTPASEIYFKNSGQIPLYTGHVPGYKFKCGKSFTRSTIDPKRWLRGDYSM